MECIDTKFESESQIRTFGFQEVDDHNGFLRGILDQDILTKFDRPNQAPQKLSIKVNDVCFITRTISRVDGLINNARCRVLAITPRLITVQTFDRKVHFIPRIKFSFRAIFLRTSYAVSAQTSVQLHL